MSGVDIGINANDNASPAINSVSDSLGTLQSSAEQASTQMDLFGNKVTDATSRAGNMGNAFTDSFGTMGRTMSSSLIAFDRYQISTDALANAHQRQDLALQRLNIEIEKYGANSMQAARAQQELEISTRGVEIAQERMTVRMLMGLLVVLPNMISNVRELIAMLQTERIQALLTAEAFDAMAAAELAVVTAGIALPIAITAIALASSGGGVTGGGNTTNIYGDYNVHGGQASASTMSSAMATNTNMSANP